jgi:hypothetical protein
MKLFGGMIAWRANKQDTVTTSTTEAELLALSQAAKEAFFTSRMLAEMTIGLTGPLIVEYDNTQTVGLMTKAAQKLQTKLRRPDEGPPQSKMGGILTPSGSGQYQDAPGGKALEGRVASKAKGNGSQPCR